MLATSYYFHRFAEINTATSQQPFMIKISRLKICIREDVKIQELPTSTNFCDLWLIGLLNYYKKKIIFPLIQHLEWHIILGMLIVQFAYIVALSNIAIFSTSNCKLSLRCEWIKRTIASHMKGIL